jgi:hypothetical protein
MSTGMLKPYNVTAVISGTIQSVQTYHHIFTKHFKVATLVLFLDVSAVISMDASWKFLILTAWLSGGGLEVLIGMTAGLSLKVLNLFDISICSLVSKNVVEKFGRPH